MPFSFFNNSFRIALALFVVFTPVFYYFSTIHHLDMYGHCLHIQAFVETGIWRPNVGYYLLVWALAFFSTDFFILQLSTGFVLAFFVAWKFWLSTKLLVAELGKEKKALLNFTMLLLAFVFSLPVWYNNWYFGQIPPNHWHNSTTIMLFPFALLLFWESYHFLENPEPSMLPFLVLLTLLNVLVKPSFFFCVAMVYPLFLLSSFRFKRAFWLGLVPVVVGILGVGIQYYFLYASGPEAAELLSGEGGGVKIAPFHIWNYYSKNILLSILFSFPLPLFFFVLYRKKLRQERLFFYALALLGAAVFIFAFFSETGRREYHSNFIWQAIVASYVLHWVCVLLFFKWRLLSLGFKGLDKPEKALVYLYVFQAFIGVLYVIRMLLKHGSYA
ncbi:hypothetical protein R9C00_08865 [Flammeovirgaceae bacterium SG7u.111]|nr:hypothetical protein [Flammeovirgaceae bacterium SG7u.132]WPO37559.1 hypothetical protein R9C00_08865 [Flammeovirgaceae bacterium SG7u.111]